MPYGQAFHVKMWAKNFSPLRDRGGVGAKNFSPLSNVGNGELIRHIPEGVHINRNNAYHYRAQGDRKGRPYTSKYQFCRRQKHNLDTTAVIGCPADEKKRPPLSHLGRSSR
jgi:hypothetical protein